MKKSVKATLKIKPASKVLCETIVSLTDELQNKAYPQNSEANLFYILCLLQSLYVIPMSEADAASVETFLLEYKLPRKQVTETIESRREVELLCTRLKRKMHSRLGCGND